MTSHREVRRRSTTAARAQYLTTTTDAAHTTTKDTSLTPTAHYTTSTTYQQDNMDQVHPQLTITDIDGARTEPLNDYDTVLTTCQDSIEDHIPTGVDYHHFNMSDGPENQYGGRSDYDIFRVAASTLLLHLQRGDSVLIHCHHGQSRSAAVAIAALAAQEDAEYGEMHDHVQNERPQVQPDELLEAHANRFIRTH